MQTAIPSRQWPQNRKEIWINMHLSWIKDKPQFLDWQFHQLIKSIFSNGMINHAATGLPVVTFSPLPIFLFLSHYILFPKTFKYFRAETDAAVRHKVYLADLLSTITVRQMNVPWKIQHWTMLKTIKEGLFPFL